VIELVQVVNAIDPDRDEIKPIRDLQELPVPGRESTAYA
jgi:hypothetical protein